MSFFAVLFVAGIVALIVWAIRSATDRRHHEGAGGPGMHVGSVASPRDPALEELRRRYAAGEITREEFEAIDRDLRR